MSFQVYTGSGGLPGWAMLKRTAARQTEVVAQDPQLRGASSHFRDKIGTLSSADDLVGDYRMLNVALKAFGLEGDIKNKAFINKILESDLSDDRSLANRLSDKRYLRLAQVFGFGQDGAARTTAPGFADRILTQYVEREFETRVGEGDQNLRLALNAKRELAQMGPRSASNATKWYEVLGNTPLRKVFEGAFGFGASYARLPIDRQFQEFTDAAERMFGSADFAELAKPENTETLIRNFLARSAVQVDARTNRFSTALALLSGR